MPTTYSVKVNLYSPPALLSAENASIGPLSAQEFETRFKDHLPIEGLGLGLN